MQRVWFHRLLADQTSQKMERRQLVTALCHVAAFFFYWFWFLAAIRREDRTLFILKDLFFEPQMINPHDQVHLSTTMQSSVYALLILLLTLLQMPHGVVTARPWFQSMPRPLACWRPRDQRSAWLRWTPQRRLNWPKSMVCGDIPPSSSSRAERRGLPKSTLVSIGLFFIHTDVVAWDRDYLEVERSGEKLAPFIYCACVMLLLTLMLMFLFS